MTARHTEMLEMAEKSLKATRIHRVLLRVAEAFETPCETCGGLEPGLPPTCYDDIEECQCKEQ